MFRFEHVEKKYIRRRSEGVALSAPSLEIARGSYVAIVGPSGSGKTTLLSMLGGMLAPTTGTIRLNGQSLYAMSVAERAELRREKIGFVFQTFNLVSYLTALENVQVPLYLAGYIPAEQRKRAMSLLEEVGLGDRWDHKPSELSVGQQQRVALARTMANNPQLILADEPTGNLDPATRERVLGFFDRWHREGRTIVMVTHDQHAAARSERQILLEDGRITSSPGESIVQAA